MRIIAERERSPREVYCGAIGYLSPDGSASFNVAIRTLWLQGQSGMTGIGGGVVADSNVEQEYEECCVKARWFEAARRPIGLIEVLRWDGQFLRLDRHLERMRLSARFLSLPFDESRARQMLREAISNATGRQRVRLELDEDGRFACTTETLVETSPWRFVLSPKRTLSKDRLLAHKVTWRDMYDAEWLRHCAPRGLQEVLFLNERGELTDGSRTNVFLRLKGAWYTPDLSAGLLPGILRAELLSTGFCREAILTFDDVVNADEVRLGNSARGLMQAISVDQGPTKRPPIHHSNP